MAKSIFIVTIIVSCLTACGQNKSTPTSTKGKTGKDTIIVEKAQNSYDTSKIVILNFQKTDAGIFKDKEPAQLNDNDFSSIETILNSCIQIHNEKQDTTKLYSKVINLTNYRRQYVAYTNSNGEKIVYVNCFCNSDTKFDYWRKQMVQVEDGGNCYFQVSINLTKMTYEDFRVNGEA